MKHLSLGLLALFGSFGLPSCSPAPTGNDTGTVRIHWVRDPENLDPLVVDNSSAYEVANLTNCSLLCADDSTLEYAPWLAEAFPAVKRNGDTLLVSYRLRPEATWDNGTPVLARDVAFTLKVMNCPGLPIEMDQAMFGFVRDIRLDPADPRRFTLVCQGVSPDHIRTSGDYSILPEYVLDPQGQLRTIPLPRMAQSAAAPAIQDFVRRYQALQLAGHPERLPGCGPYQVSNWQHGRFLTLTRKPAWWADALSAPPPQLRAYPTRLVYQIIPDAATATLALRRGELDLYPLTPASEFARLQKSAAEQQKLAFSVTDSYDFLAANFNMRPGAKRDALTRQALSALFDVPALIQGTQQGKALRSVSLISPRVRQYYNDSLPLPAFSPTQARALLQQAGWQQPTAGLWQRQTKNGTTEQLEVKLHYRAGEPSFETIALQFKAAAARLGIPVELYPTEQSLLSRQARAGKTDITLRTFTGNPFSYDFTPLLHSRGFGASNTSEFATPVSDALIEQIAVAESPALKARLLRKFQRVLYEERPFTVLYFVPYRMVASRRLGRVPAMGIRPGYMAARIQPVAAR